ncbi:MAG: hypothetical protein ACTHPS_14250 [Streptosporangiaceae bacterium]
MSAWSAWWARLIRPQITAIVDGFQMASQRIIRASWAPTVTPASAQAPVSKVWLSWPVPAAARPASASAS